MRLIDADKFEAFMYQNDNDDFDNGVQFVLEMIDKAQTACDIEKIVAEISENGNSDINTQTVLQIINKHTKGA